MNIDHILETENLSKLDEKYEHFSENYQLVDSIKDSGRIEQVYLSIDNIVNRTKKIYPESYCISCSLTCCINDLFLPTSFLEWKAIETYLNKKVSFEIKEKIKENLKNIDMSLFKEIEYASKEKSSYKFKSCPLLIENKCSIKPYRPISCRTYGTFITPYINTYNKRSSELKHENVFKTCALELSRWKLSLDISKQAPFLPTTFSLEKVLKKFNLDNNTEKLLIVWLKDYFKEIE